MSLTHTDSILKRIKPENGEDTQLVETIVLFAKADCAWCFDFYFEKQDIFLLIGRCDVLSKEHIGAFNQAQRIKRKNLVDWSFCA